MRLSDLYRLSRLDNPNNGQARELLRQTNWFTVNSIFDPKTGEALPQALSAFLAKVARTPVAGTLHDRLWRITEHARPSVERLFRALNKSPHREHALLPVRAVRELDASSFVKLSNRPGRNLREKLAGKPYLQAVRRFQSVNLPENRLLKAFVARLAELLELRRDCLGEEEDELLLGIHSWFRSDEAHAIARWDNLPPNNTLLSHRDYRRVWDAWRWLQSLDDDIARDFSQLGDREETMRAWNEYGRLYVEGDHRFAEMPVLFDYEKFEVRSWLPQVAFQKAPHKITRTLTAEKILDPVCVDLTVLRPRFATATKGFQALRDTYLWQHWKTGDEFVDIELFNSDAAYLHSDATSISSIDLFFFKEKTSEYFDRAVRAFASKLSEAFKSKTIIWLVPDSVNDFELDTIRRNLNARFPEAEPLPRSVAAVFEQVDYSKIKRDGFPIVVIDTIGGKTCVTKLIARLDAELKKRLPETGGFYWERCPPVTISSTNPESTESKVYDLITIDDKGQWREEFRPQKPSSIDLGTLKPDSRIGHFEFPIRLAKSPVAGGIRLYSLQQRAGGIPLWRDQIPELSIKVMKDGRYQRFHLVSRGETAKPIRGSSISISVLESFTLRAGRPFYQFPLFQGENAEDLGFSARLDSPAFPVKTDTICKLSLTFAYGADEPYKLIFIPLDESFPPVRATWRRTVEEIIKDAPAPQYPTPMMWEDLRHFPDTKLGGTMDLIQKLILTEGNLNKWLHRADFDAWDKLKKSIIGWCRFLFFSVWRDGRSLSDSRCPTECSNAANGIVATVRRAITLPEAEEHSISLYDVMVLFCAMHKDMPDECVRWITEQVEVGDIRDPRAVGFALGDVSEGWQQYIFDCLASRPNNSVLSSFAYAIWREQHFVERFSLSELKAILHSLSQRLAKINSLKSDSDEMKDKWILRDWVRATTETLEFLLGLLRTRASKNPEIKLLLQPNQKITKVLARQVERVTEIVAQSNVHLFSRVQLNLQKPADDRTPDLLYALRLYLTGDDGANAIHITSVSDSDND